MSFLWKVEDFAVFVRSRSHWLDDRPRVLLDGFVGRRIVGQCGRWPRLGVGSATDAQPALARTGRQNSPGPAAADHIRHIRGAVCLTVCVCVRVCACVWLPGIMYFIKSMESCTSCRFHLWRGRP